MDRQLEKLKLILGEVADLHAAAAVLEWDQQTYMPRGGAEGRGRALATLQQIAHNRFISPEVGHLLEDLEKRATQMDPDSNDARLVKVTAREYRKRIKVPPEMVEEFAQLTTMAYDAWAAARENNDFASFRPFLDKVLDNRRRYVELFAPYDHIYDVLLDDFEPGMKTAEVQAIFNTLRPQQVALIQSIESHTQIDDSFLHQVYDKQKQLEFGKEVVTKFGYDWDRGRQDLVPHPFCTTFNLGDVRITTRVIPNFINSALFGTMHECGHALYEQGSSRELERTPLAGGASSAIHESQSRLWENIVGRSLPFWEHFYPRLKQIFPEQLSRISLERFYKAVNRVKPSLIRIRADEATYNLHIMLRMELEIALLEGKLETKDLPEAWNSHMQSYLGLTPPTDTDGVLQDVHWSSGLIGYFPTYALGNLIGAQLLEVIRREIPDLDDQFRRGDFQALLGWLRKNIHRHGSKFEPQELMVRVTGSKIDPAPYMHYLTEKINGIYG